MLKISEETHLQPILVETHDHPAHCHIVEAEPDDNPWYYDIKTFLKDGNTRTPLILQIKKR